MTKRIKITGYLNPDDMDPTHVDLAHETGLSEKGYLELDYDMEDMTIELVDDG